MGCSCLSNANTNTYHLLKKAETINFDKIIIKIVDKPRLSFGGYLTLKNLEELCFKEFSELKELNISNNKLIDISPLKEIKAPKLEKIDLSHNEIKNLTGKTNPFKDYNFPQLKELNLSHNILTNVFELKAIKAPKLKLMNISNNHYNANNLTQNFDIFKFTFDFPELEQLDNELRSSPKSITEINNEIIKNQIIKQ